MESLIDAARPAAHLLIERGETVAVAESSAAGLIAASLLGIPGASSYFLGGGVIYTQIAREGLLGISREDMAGIRSSSEPYALLLARKIRERTGAVWGLSETGASGPSGNRYGDSPGHTCMAVSGAAVSGPLEKSITLETGLADRVENMRRFTRSTLELLLLCLKEAPESR